MRVLTGLLRHPHYDPDSWLLQGYQARLACFPFPLGTICSAQTHLSVSALLWVSRAACRSFSSRLRAISSCSTSPWVHFRGLMKRISFSSSSFSLMRISRSLSESSTPGQASLSSLASWILRLAILGVEKVSVIDEQ